MASGSYQQVRVTCPFYLEDDGRSKIKCEGLVSGSICIQSFRRKCDYERHVDRFCTSNRYGDCTLAKMLAKKYEREV